MRALKSTWVLGIIGMALASAEGVAWGAGVEQKYEEKWGGQEKRALTASQRATLANDLLEAAQQAALDARTPRKRGKSIFSEDDALKSLSGEKKAEMLFVCGKVYDIGSKQAESYWAASQALGMIQIVEPSRRAECLGKLERLYQTEYERNPNANVGMAKGLARTRLQLGTEKWVLLSEKQNKERMTPAQFAAEAKGVADVYASGLRVIRTAIGAVKPHARENAKYMEFVEEAEKIESELLDVSKLIDDPMKKALEVERAVKAAAVCQERLKKNAADAAAADRLVRLSYNELGDMEMLKQAKVAASPTLKVTLGLLDKPVEKLSASEALGVGKWIDKINDNAESPARGELLVRTRVYLDRYTEANPTKDAEFKQIELMLKRVATDLAKLQMDDATVVKLAAEYKQSREEAVVASAAPTLPPEPEKPATVEKPVKPVEPETVPEKPVANPPVAVTKVENPPEPAKPQADAWSKYRKTQAEPARETGGKQTSIFDFGM